MRDISKNICKYLFLLFLFVGCTSVKTEKITGKYRWYGIYGVASSIALHEDHTFIYTWRTGLIGETTSGKWALHKNELILDSNLQPVKEDFKVISREKIPKSQFEIKVIDGRDKVELYSAVCMLMNDTTIVKGVVTDIHGDCVLPFDEKADFLKVTYVGYREVEIPIDELTSNSFVIELKEKTGYYRYFTNVRWKVKRKRLYDPKIEKHEYTKKRYFKRVKIKD